MGGGDTYGKPVAWVNVSGPGAPTGGAGAHDSLRTVLGYSGADIVEPACVRIPISRSLIGPAGLVADPVIREQLAGVLATLCRHVADRRAE